ncbi:MAG: alpha/beta fold hydrolase [Candidatus Hydrogenedentota bacterium]|nr:MAG: alpha/beta fold hydrolase [Candidatus Hydrogenedentota bacterium]
MTKFRSGIVALLFTDIEHTPELFQRLSGSRIRALWRTLFDLLRTTLGTQVGHEVKNLGDGLMVVFPSVRDAVACAVSLQQAISLHNKKQGNDYGLQARVGIHIGEPIHDKGDYMGMPVLIAKRLCEFAQGGQILATDLVRRLVGPHGGHAFWEMGMVSLRGIGEPVAVCEVAWSPIVEDSPGRFPLPPLLENSRGGSFAGRGKEMTQLRKHWARVRAGQCQLVMLAGDTGIGKTRLAAEFALAAHAEGATILFGSTEKDMIPYRPFAEALRHYIISCPADTLRSQVGTGGTELARLVPELAQRLPELGALPQVGSGNEHLPLIDAISNFLTQVSQASPVILVLDNLNRADELTLLLLQHIVRSREQSPLLILGTYRPMELSQSHPLSETLAGLGRDSAFRKLSLEGLDREEIGAMISTRVGQEPPPTLVRSFHELTEGNPYFVEEVLRRFTETGGICEHDGRPRADQTIDDVGIPDGVKEVIGRRLSQLSEECKGVLTIASVVGREFGLDALERASGLPGVRLLELMEEAVAVHIVTEAAAGDRYRFSHALIHEIFYDGLSSTRRVRLHGQTLQHADSDGVKLAYEVLGGSGPYVIAIGLGNCSAVRPRNIRLARHWGRVSRFCRVILYDRRGVGSSDSPERGYSLLAGVEDLRAVLDAVGVGRAVIWGLADGGPLTIAFAARYPERTAGVILAGTTPRVYNSEDFTLGINPAIVQLFLGTDTMDRARAVSLLTYSRHDSQAARGNAEVMRQIPEHAWRKIMAAIGISDARPFLSQMRSPVLIIHDPDNDYIPVEAAYYLHEHLPHSELEVTDEYGEDLYGDALYRKIEEFVGAVADHHHNTYDLADHHCMKTQETLSAGDPGQASLHAELALKFAADAGPSFLTAKCHLGKAYVMHELGKHGEAEKNLTRAFSVAREVNSLRAEFNAFWAAAEFALDLGDEASCLRALRKALAMGRERGYLTTLLDRPTTTAKLCVKALETEIETEYVQRIIMKQNLMPDKPPLHLESWPWAVKIYTLGRFGLVIGGKPVQFPRKAQQKLLAMLKVLIAFGGREVREEQISDVLWPDAEGDMAHKSFAPTLHRLRKFLRHHDALQLRDGHLTLDPRYCWVDVWAFGRLLGQADAKWGEGSNAEAAQMTQKAIDIYRGAFLAGEIWEPWTVPIRERLRSKFLRGIEKLGSYWEDLEEWGRALECYRRALEADQLAEEFYRRLMLCHQQLGQKAEAIGIYDRCKQTLSAALGIEPAPETEAIRKSLLSEKNS